MSWLVLDNGASHIKLADSSGIISITPNLIARTRDRKTHIGAAISSLSDYSSLHLRRPSERGYLTDFSAQKAIWDAILPPLKNKHLILTEPYFNLPELEESLETFLFQEYGIDALFRVPAAVLASFTLKKREAVLILDCGYSYTHSIPILKGSIQHSAVKRLDIGGKVLTNLLKETLSYTQWDMMDETFLTNIVKEKCCFIAHSANIPVKGKEWSYNQLMEKTKTVAVEYCLPDYATVPQDDRARFGYVRNPQKKAEEEEQVLKMEKERFQIPEVLFNPGQIGLDQCSLPELVEQSIAELPKEWSDIMWSNIVLVGGSANIPGLKQRLVNELRAMAPSDVPVEITMVENPQETAILGGLELIKAPQGSPTHKFLISRMVTRSEWLAKGTQLSRERFDSWSK